MERRIPLRWQIALGVTALILAFTVYPGRWLSTQPFIAVLSAPRSLWIVVSLCAFVASCVVFGIRWYRRMPRRVSALFMLITLVAAFANIVIGWGDGLRADPVSTVSTPQPGYFGTDITVMHLNTHHSTVSPGAIASLASSAGADIISLTETTRQSAKTVARLMEDQGTPMQVFVSENEGSEGSVALLVSLYFGTYEFNPDLTPQITQGAVVVTPVDHDANADRLPVLAAAHADTPGLTSTRRWKKDVSTLMQLCMGTPGLNIIMGGDFNAARWHGVLANTGHCADALGESLSGSVGTWPTYLPKHLGIPIDHIFVTSAQWVTQHSTLTEIEGGDHRVLLATLQYAPAPWTHEQAGKEL